MGWWGPPEMRCGRPRNMPLPTGYFAKCGSSTWKCTSVTIEICWKKYDPSRPACQGHSRFITGTDTDQSATYDFLLVIQSYHGQEGLHCTVFDKQRFWSKIAIFSHPCIFIDSSEGVSRGIFLTLVVFKKLGSYSYQKAERIWQCEHTSQCHGWTDRRMNCQTLSCSACWCVIITVIIIFIICTVTFYHCQMLPIWKSPQFCEGR